MIEDRLKSFQVVRRVQCAPVEIGLCADMKLETSSEPAVSVTQSLPTEDQPGPEASWVDGECHLRGQRIVAKR